jgi:hypothetical protein
MRHPPLLRCTSIALAALASALFAFAAVALAASTASADPAGKAVRSVFFIAKSENRNEVHYGIALDAGCVPEGRSPVFAYWRMRERGPLATEPLLSREVPIYGVADPQQVERAEQGGRVVFRLNALPKRMIAIDARPGADGTCTAVARAVIGGVPATLANVFVQLRWPFGIDSIAMTGRAESDGHVVRERLSPP